MAKKIIIILLVMVIAILVLAFIVSHFFGIDLISFDRDHPRLTREILDRSLELGTTYLLNNQTSQGNFNYAYDFVAGKLLEGDNQVRQAGALWGLALIYQDNPNTALENALLKGFDFFRKHTRSADDGRKWIEYPGTHSGRTGTVALVALAHIDFLRGADHLHPETESVLKEDLDGFIRFLASLRRPDRLFHASYKFNNGNGIGSSSPYFDGETLLALVKAALYIGKDELEPLILESADAAHRIHVVEALEKEPDSSTTKGFYQWGSMTFSEIYMSNWRTGKDYGEIVMRLADWMIDVHKTLWRTRNTAYAYEGIIHAYHIALMKGDMGRVKKFKSVIDTGLYKLTSWQVGSPIQNRFLKKHPTNDNLAVGGIMNHRKEPMLRIDVTQHQMHAVILARRYVFTNNPEISIFMRDINNDVLSDHPVKKNEISLLFLGDTSFGETYQEDREHQGKQNILKQKGYAYSLQNFKPFLLETDLVLANLEAPVTTLEESPYGHRKQYIHRENPEKCLPEFQAHNFRAFSLANNHAMDFGVEGLLQTFNFLDTYGFQYFGAGVDEGKAAHPLYIDVLGKSFDLKFAVIACFEYSSVYKKLYDYYASGNKGGVYGLDVRKIRTQIRKIKEKDMDRMVIVFPHWGKNYRWKTKNQSEIARKLIDAGADLIIGHGSHMLQEIQLLNDHLVVYSLGNFMFNSPGRYTKKGAPPYSFIAKLVAMLSENGLENMKLKLYPIVSDNRKTGYQGRFVDEQEFREIRQLLFRKSQLSVKNGKTSMIVDSDRFGHYFEIELTFPVSSHKI